MMSHVLGAGAKAVDFGGSEQPLPAPDVGLAVQFQLMFNFAGAGAWVFIGRMLDNDTFALRRPRHVHMLEQPTETLERLLRQVFMPHETPLGMFALIATNDVVNQAPQEDGLVEQIKRARRLPPGVLVDFVGEWLKIAPDQSGLTLKDVKSQARSQPLGAAGEGGGAGERTRTTTSMRKVCVSHSADMTARGSFISGRQPRRRRQ